MKKKVRLLDYKDQPKGITIEDFEKVKVCIFEIKSGDGVLTIIYQDNRKQIFDSSDNRLVDFNDGLWVIDPENIDIISEMENHYDTNKLDIYESEN